MLIYLLDHNTLSVFGSNSCLLSQPTWQHTPEGTRIVLIMTGYDGFIALISLHVPKPFKLQKHLPNDQSTVAQSEERLTRKYFSQHVYFANPQIPGV